MRAAAESVLGREAARDLDRQTIALGPSGNELMEKAGRAIADLLDSGQIAQAAPRIARAIAQPTRRILILAGLGNNGGDGFVVARLLAERGWRPAVVLVAGEPSGPGDAADNLRAWRAVGGRVLEDTNNLREEARGCGLVLDCVFGNGLTRSVDKDLAATFEQVENAAVPVVACDIPSGLCADTGMVLGKALAADATITLGCAKPGLFLRQGPDTCGRIHVVDIGLVAPAEADSILSYGPVLTAAATARLLERRNANFHKGNAGHVLVVAGGEGKQGAALLAARGALRAGAGLVTMALPEAAGFSAGASLIEAMRLTTNADEKGDFAESAVPKLLAKAASVDAVVVGPGIGQGAGAAKIVRELILQARCQLVIDADGLNVLPQLRPTLPVLLERRRSQDFPEVILTPHPGEMATLLSTTSARIQSDRLGSARQFVRDCGAVLVLKGAGTLVADAKETAWNTTGNPAMASPGMGDVLSGVIGAFAASGQSPVQAARIGVWTHGRAADLLFDRLGAPGFLASEVADAIPQAVASLLR